MNKKYKCKDCDWIGTEKELEYDTTETCFGDDKIEMCPVCSSYNIIILSNEVG